eukprot:CAMPEP_0197514862 /NCGR_PEP_ID=MMETSP1318-20131121/168_1 /TAXON_ID=552666 /ORGANISM="Partenskyella glossopodia, Strain RCC365" /LENGTH=117 /DNA_ID=CAMNT_0043063071 /DNA_START=44 /DNA_END=397 /DNA_ORIENTATION=-
MKPGLLFALLAAVAVVCMVSMRQQELGVPMTASRAARSVRVGASNLRMQKSWIGSWGDAIEANARGKGVGGKQKEITKKQWWNCLDPKWSKPLEPESSPEVVQAKQWINEWKKSTSK